MSDKERIESFTKELQELVQKYKVRLEPEMEMVLRIHAMKEEEKKDV